MRQYHTALDGRLSQSASVPAVRVEHGTIDAVVVNFYRSTDFVKLKTRAQKVRRNMLEKFCLQHG